MLRPKVILDPKATEPKVSTENNALPIEGEGTGRGASAPTHYKGIPLADIIAKWWRDVEKCPECDNYQPAPGNRNAPLQRLACELTFLLDDRADWIRQTLPTYGLPEVEYNGIIDRAIKYKIDNNRMYMSREMRKLINSFLSHRDTEDTENFNDQDDDLEENSLPSGEGQGIGPQGSFLPTAPPTLPPGIQQFVDACVTPSQKAVAAVSALVGYGVLLSNLRARVSKGTVEQIPIILAYCWGKTNAGKTSLTRSVINEICGAQDDDTLETLRGMDNCFLAQWLEVQKQAQATGGGAKKMPVLPNFPFRCLADDFTPPAFLKTLMDARSMGALLYCPEHDLMTMNGNMAAWKQIDGRLRTMFDGEWISAKRVSVNAVSGKARALGCCLICGTDSNVAEYFTAKQVLNGLANRMVFLHLTMPQGQRVYPRALTKKERSIVRSMSRKALDQNVMVQEVTDSDGNLTYDVQRGEERQLRLEWLWDRLTREFEEVELQRAMLENSDARESLVPRSKEVAFRAGMVMHWLWGCKQSPEAQERLFQACMWVAYTMLNGLLELFQSQVDGSQSPLKLNVPQASVWELLDDTFTREQLANVLRVLGKKELPYNVLSKWRHLQLPGNDEEGVIEKISDHYYKKGTDAWKAAKAVQAENIKTFFDNEDNL